MNERSPVHSVFELQEMLKDEIQRSQGHAVKVNQLIHQLMRKQLKAQQESAKRFGKLCQRITKMHQLTNFSSTQDRDEPESSEQVHHHNQR